MQSSFATNYMWAAYIAVWLIHGSYLLYLRRESQKLRAEIAESRQASDSGRG